MPHLNLGGSLKTNLICHLAYDQSSADIPKFTSRAQEAKLVLPSAQVFLPKVSIFDYHKTIYYYYIHNHHHYFTCGVYLVLCTCVCVCVCVCVYIYM